MAVEMELVGIEMERPPNIPCLVLKETAGAGRLLPIFIGSPEATAIALALEEVETPRPMTHDLVKDLLDEIGARIERVTVTEIRESTFYAEILVRSGTEVHAVSARPSDAVALAVRFGAPVFAEEGVLDEAARPAEDGGLPDDVLDQFRAFINDVNPEDFAS